MYIESFASRLRKARANTGFTQREIAKELNISKSTIASYETGRTEPDIETLGILADFYEVDLNWIVGTKGKKSEDNYQYIREKNKDSKKRA